MNAIASSSRLTALPSFARAASTSASQANGHQGPRVAKTVPVPGFNHFVTPLRKLVVDYNEVSAAQNGVRSFIRSPLIALARENPDVEVLVRRVKQGRAAVLRGFYVNGRDKVICVNSMEANEVENKAKLLLSSSGAKIKHLKRLQIEAGPGGESARGIWSGLHSLAGEQGYRV